MSAVIALHQASLVDQRFADRPSTMLEPGLRHLAEHLRGTSEEPEAKALRCPRAGTSSPTRSWSSGVREPEV
ncbi:hypothetical protein ACWDKQ_26625 [Saccharopolyspora sp. NPDC000995]